MFFDNISISDGTYWTHVFSYRNLRVKLDRKSGEKGGANVGHVFFVARIDGLIFREPLFCQLSRNAHNKGICLYLPMLQRENMGNFFIGRDKHFKSSKFYEFPLWRLVFLQDDHLHLNLGLLIAIRRKIYYKYVY